MSFRKTLSIVALSLALTTSFSTAAVFADSSNNSTAPNDIGIESMTKPVTIYMYYNVGDGVPQYYVYNSDGWYGTLPLVSYDISNGVVYAKYSGNVFK